MRRESRRGARGERVGRREGEARERGPSRESLNYIIYCDSGTALGQLRESYDYIVR